MKRFTLTLALTLGLSLAGTVHADVLDVDIKFTAKGLGFTTDDKGTVNHGKTVDPDVPGKMITSTTPGEGSILYIQTDGKAGSGTTEHPLFATVTGKSHLDTTTGIPANSDYQAGVITLSKEDSHTPDGVKEGMGIKAFTVDETTGLRTYDKGMAKIEGSKHLSGATGPTTYTWTDDKGKEKGPNGAPHVDESILFDIHDDFQVPAQNVGVTVSDFDADDMLDVYIELISGERKAMTSLNLTSTGIGGAPVFTNLGDPKLWLLDFSLLNGLLESDYMAEFTLRAVEAHPDDPSDKADHFYVSGMLFDDISPVPEPVTMSLMGVGAIALLRHKRN